MSTDKLNRDLQRIGHALDGMPYKPIMERCIGGCGEEYDVNDMKVLHQGKHLWVCMTCLSAYLAAHPVATEEFKTDLSRFQEIVRARRAADMAQHPTIIEAGPDLDAISTWEPKK
ncbi:MAG: hypothetical protein V1929_06570 [bacterium]